MNDAIYLIEIPLRYHTIRKHVDLSRILTVDGSALSDGHFDITFQLLDKPVAVELLSPHGTTVEEQAAFRKAFDDLITTWRAQKEHEAKTA